ncbi:MAG: FAD-dependent thymidylate synthase [Clostridiales bacterium]|nr:FAD-dependent thymidylate synthase [Clostridiales bacterium]
MKVSVIATTKLGVESKENFDMFSGKAAGICYMPASFEELMAEDTAKTLRRVEQTKNSGHHSVYDHNSISLYLEDVPKFIAMILNNEKQYTTSEKSARYTRMKLTEKEELIYNKWIEIFKGKITKKYAKDYPTFFTDSKIEKLAQENARYLISVFTPTSLMYTTTYRQLNYLISFIDKELSALAKSDFGVRVHNELRKFVELLKALPYYDPKLCANEKDRILSIFADEKKKVEEYFGDVYATTYKASFACLAQAQRHRTIHYTMRVLEDEYYVPPIIADSPDFVELWITDIKDLGNIYPQATLLEINEMGTLDAFILKMKERKCTNAQLEINRVTNDILKKYAYALRMKIHSRAEEIIEYTKGSRCTFPDYKCPTPCGFALGVDETREI